MSFEENLDDILSDMEIESKGKKQEEEKYSQRDKQRQRDEGARSMAKKGERQYLGEKQFSQPPTEVTMGKKKKRKPSEYNIFIGKCMHGGKDMKTCAAEYAEYKASGGHGKSNESGKSNEKGEERKEKDKEEFIGIFTAPAEVCPSCEEAKIKLEKNLNDVNDENWEPKIVELNITKDKKANDLYQLLGADKKGTPAFARFTKDTVCLLNDDLEVEEESCVATEKGKGKEKGEERKRGERRSDSIQTQTSDVKNVYLITSTGCPSCDMVEREMKNDIDRGSIQVLNVQESDLGADLVIKLQIMEVPKMVYEKIDGTFGIVGE